MTDNGQQSNGNGDASENELERMFRSEGTISDASLRVDVAKTVAQLIAADERQRLENKSIHVRGGLSVKTVSRDRHVEGDWTRHVEKAATRSIGSRVEETVQGSVKLKSAVEGESIVGGAYANFVTGGFMRVAVWVDYLIWGGWIAVDVSRIEAAGAMIRSYMGYVHAIGARVLAAGILVDDFSSRTETFGICSDQTTGDNYLMAPGGGTSMEA